MSKAELSAIIETARAHPFSPEADEKALRARLDRFADLFAPPEGVEIEVCSLGSVTAERLTAHAGGPLILFFHGGGYVMGSAKSHRHLGALLALEVRGEVYLPNYRLAPEAPFPASLEDAITAYCALCDGHTDRPVFLVGDSAGGGLVYSLAVAIRDRGFNAPAGLIGLSPWVNLGDENESYDKLAGVDALLSRPLTAYCSSRYLAGLSPQDPRVSPLFAELSDLPPSLIQVGDHEVFFGDAMRMHQALIAAGVDTELTIWKGMFHVWQLYWPVLSEGRDAVKAVAQFVLDRTELMLSERVSP